MKKPRPTTLAGDLVTLRPLERSDVDGLLEIALDPNLWKWTGSIITSRADLLEYIDAALHDRESGNAIPFAICLTEGLKPVGSTRYANISVRDSRLEIGWTWLGAAFQRTGINTQAKRLLLTHAFELLGCKRVELKTHSNNLKSRQAMRRIGAVEEGTLRNHMLFRDGLNRDTVFYSIIDSEWPSVKKIIAGLEAR